MAHDIIAQPLTKDAFAPFGDVLEVVGKPDKMINAGLCGRYHDLARLDFVNGKAGISLFHAEQRSLPYQFDLLERHPLGSQAFIPMAPEPFLVIVAADLYGKPDTPLAFITKPYQGINFHRNIWHGVLTPIAKTGVFAVVDCIGSKCNLEEYRVPESYIIHKK